MHTGIRKKMMAAALLGISLASVGPFRSTVAYARYVDSELRAVETTDESRIRELRDEEVKQLRIALGRRMPKNRMADLYFRLAEIHLEAYRSEFILEGRAHEKRLERGEQDNLIDRAHSQPHLREGIQACKEIVGYKIAYEKLDRVYYFLAFNYGELGQRKESLRYYDYLTRNFPGSAFVGEAYREMGDDAYDHAEFRKAQAYYEMAVKRAPEDGRPRLLHKLAWSYYRVKSYDRAVTTMKEAIESASKSGERFLSLREEALRDLAIFMTETGQVDEAIEYFRRVAGDDSFYPKALERLGKQYERNVEPIKATRVYESLLRTRPNSEAAFRTRVKLVDLDLRRGLYPQALGRINGIELPKSGEPETVVAAQNLKAMIRRTATEKHDNFRKKGNRADLATAELFYTAYLNEFLAKDDPRNETPEIYMYLAEVKRELGKSQEASDLYRKVVQSRDKRYAKEAGALWTASLAESIKKQGNQTGGVKFSDPSKLELEFVDAADRLQEALGDTPEGRDAALRSAQVLAGYKNTQPDAIARSKKIIEAKPHSTQALVAARLWLQVESDRYTAAAATKEGGDEDKLRDTVRIFRENPELMSADSQLGQNKLKNAMADEETRLKIKNIATREKDNDYAEAAKGYEQLAAGSSARDLSEKAYVSAVRTYLKAEDTQSVDRVYSNWVRRYPLPAAGSKDNKPVDIGREVATHYLITGRFDLAIALFERLGTEMKDADSLETASRLAEGTGDVPRAQALLQRHITTYPASPQRGRLILASARLAESAKQDSVAASAYANCQSASAEISAECTARLADLSLRQGDVAQAKVLYRKLAGAEPLPVAAPTLTSGKKGQKKPAPKLIKTKVETSSAVFSPFVAYARYKLAELQEKEARFDPMQLPEAVLKKGLGQRVQFLETLNRAYSFAADAGGPWGVAALERFSSWAANFADEIDRIEPPAAASEDAKSKFRGQLKQLSDPIRTKAQASRREVYAKAVVAEALSPALPELGDRLADQGAGGGLARAQGPRGHFRLAGIGADGGSDGAKTAFQATRDKLLKNPQDPAAWLDYGNLLWGDGKPVLARVAYERALALYPAGKGAPATNNRAVVSLTSAGEEDWFASNEALQAFTQASQQDGFFIPAKANRALLFNYYRLFSKARPLWEELSARQGQTDLSDFQDGLGVSLQGAGDALAAEAAFNRGTEAGASKSRFANLYHRAARLSVGGSEGADKCVDVLEDIDAEKISGFEKLAVENLRKTCTRWKDSGKGAKK